MASQAYEIAFSLLTKNPETPWTKVKAACERKGVNIVPVVYGRAKREAAPHLVKKKVKKVAAVVLTPNITDYSAAPRKKVTKAQPIMPGVAVSGTDYARTEQPTPRKKAKPRQTVAAALANPNGLLAELTKFVDQQAQREADLRDALIQMRSALNNALELITILEED